LLLFGELVDTLPLDEAAIETEVGEPLVTRRIAQRHNHGRSTLPEQLERIEIEHDLDSPACPACGNERCRIGAEVSEQLEYFPANFKVLRHIRHQYGCAKCDGEGYHPHIEVAAKPPQPIAKGLPGPGLLAYVITSKLADHLPLYRLEQIFARQQVSIARSTMCGWIAAAGQLVEPLVKLMTTKIKESRVIHTDDTPLKVQPPKGAGRNNKCLLGRIWCYRGDAEHPYIVYDFTPNRKRAGPVSWLGDYKGYLQADAYSGYDELFNREQVQEVACWAHARRKFYDAQDSDGLRARQILTLIGGLYDVEREATAQKLDAAARLALRQARSTPLLAQIRAWLDAPEQAVVSRRSALGKALTYAENQWTALTTYTTEGFLAIDNNPAERALKPIALGRKNWLFAGTVTAATHHARLASLIASCARHGVDPQRYLTSVLAKIGQTPEEELGQFLPEVWKAADAAEPLVGED
jgi:transposase